MLEIQNSPVHGKGVFSYKFIPKGTQLVCDVLLLKKDAIKTNEEFNSTLKDYVFPWDKNNYAFCVGFASYFNHSDKPNAKFYKFNREDLKIVFVTTENIYYGTEIFIQYSEHHSLFKKINC